MNDFFRISKAHDLQHILEAAVDWITVEVRLICTKNGKLCEDFKCVVMYMYFSYCCFLSHFQKNYLSSLVHLRL